MQKANYDGLTITENYEITTNEQVVTVKTVITDAELDKLNCEFHFDRTVEINTKDFEYITLTLDNLKALIKLMEKSERFFETQLKEELNKK